MWMEPDEIPPPQYSVVKSESRVVRQYSTTPQHRELNGGFQPMVNPPRHPSISRVEHFEPEVAIPLTHDVQNPATAEQNFFPSFFRNPPLNAHTRPVSPYQTQT